MGKRLMKSENPATPANSQPRSPSIRSIQGRPRKSPSVSSAKKFVSQRRSFADARKAQAVRNYHKMMRQKEKAAGVKACSSASDSAFFSSIPDSSDQSQHRSAASSPVPSQRALWAKQRSVTMQHFDVPAETEPAIKSHFGSRRKAKFHSASSVDQGWKGTIEPDFCMADSSYDPESDTAAEPASVLRKGPAVGSSLLTKDRSQSFGTTHVARHPSDESLNTAQRTRSLERKRNNLDQTKRTGTSQPRMAVRVKSVLSKLAG
ncbi:uncharacterized protein LOC135810878 [Sycon ciliatum]|uniref:uncharacterized protein LOC135810878 n=1 Tax=Sycon ciliatum TaxID=27933 RepID=UPI0031F66025